jgi:predicted enzyme related to lactoylglutathione lyase
MSAPIVHVEIAVTDLDRAKHFYGEAFGWTFEDWPGAPTPYARFRTGRAGVGGGLEQVAVPRPGGGVTIYLEVPDLQAGLRRAVACGAVVTMPPVEVAPSVGWCAAVDDPDGNRLGLFQRATPRARRRTPGRGGNRRRAAAGRRRT